MKSKFLELLAVGLLAGPMAANAVPVTLYYSAEVTVITDDVLNVFPSAGIFVGKKFTGTFVYDTATTNSDNEIAGDRYAFSAFTANGIPGSFVPIVIDAFAGDPAAYPNDYWQPVGGWDFVPGGAWAIAVAGPADFGIQNTDPAAPGFVGAGLGHPIFIPNPLSLVNAGSIGYTTMLPNFVLSLAGFSLQLSTVPPSVPEPGTLALLGLGLAGLGLSRRRKA